jgi:1-acyl-sn-glycerol-3-phosphate acyltransferase
MSGRAGRSLKHKERFLKKQTLGYKFARGIIFVIARLTTRLQVLHVERLPETSYIAVSNHLGRLDPVLVFTILNRQDIILIVAEKYRSNPIFRWLVRQLDLLFVDRYSADFATVRQVLQRLREGSVLILAPEGTRSQTEALLEGRPGASYLAAKAEVPILPVAVWGTEDRLLKANLRRLRRVPVTVNIGEPFTLPPLPRQGRDEALQEYTEEIMCRIAALLPEKYRGFYTDHPRLKEFLVEPEIG